MAVLMVVAVAGYGYLRYRWGQVKTLACTTCTPVADGQPFNVLLVGSDTRVGQSAAEFGSASAVPGQRSDTIKVLHVDPTSGTARLLSIPRDTYVTLSDVSPSSGLSGAEKINTAFNDGPSSLIATVQNTLGIPVSHFVVVDFQGLTNAVDTVGGIDLDFPYPVRDDDYGNNNAGLNISRAGCQNLNGTETLALARSRYYQYYENGEWHDDPTSDIGRIQRQNTVIQALIARARTSYNPITLNSFLGAVVHDVTVDKAMTFGDMFSLATTYHAFSPSSLQTYTLPTAPETSRSAGDVEVVEQPQAQQVLTQFLGASPSSVTTPPLDAYGGPVSSPPPAASASGSGGSAGSSKAGSAGSATSSGATSGSSPASSLPAYDPTICVL
jgi:LCP family protein required for cell wall assembly